MKNIILICAAGMSTSLLVSKMRAAATAQNYDCDISAYPVSEAGQVGQNADVILLGPQVRYNLAKIKKMCPHCPVEAIDMTDFGMMDGKKVLSSARKLMGDLED